ncbi:RING finger protein 37 isoform X1 [Oryzias melastigma]|uniref:U-box domain containing 5 n=1 Tax=Oryzias melastigma TaxID=30732 RepID=A0A3B3CNM1_ORYME|nr:RING finger protein 37 isoform X1 [Oryzias melastigma]
MVVNLCLPQFHTTVHCNKLCADGYDVTNLVSADPALRRRGFKLEYFLRPPLQVILKFGFQVELSRVDVELWPWGMDRGQACKKLEISTSSDRQLPTDHKQVEKKEEKKTEVKEQHRQNRQRGGTKSKHSIGNQWSFQAHQWGEEAPGGSQQNICVSGTNSYESDVEFKLVARCELREETHVCFFHSNFRPRAPFLSPPPPPPESSRQVELWSRGFSSLGAVTQLRVTVPFGGGASSLGLRALAVWGQPASCCPAEEVERIQKIHESAERGRLSKPEFFGPSVRKTTLPQESTPSAVVPEEFLDPITQEAMLLPMLLPSGVSVDSTTLEEYRKREAGWGRPPSDPFTGVPFTSTSQPLPNPQLKSRIDHFLLQKGMMKRDGMLGRQNQEDNPHASRLVTSNECGQSSPSVIVNTDSSESSPNRDTNLTSGQREPSSNPQSHFKSGSKRKTELELNEISKEVSTDEWELQPQTKRPRRDSASDASSGSHEQRLAASLDEALSSALKGRPSFTANLTHQGQGTSEPDMQTRTLSSPSTTAGGKVCSSCSCSVSVYSTSASCIYRLICSHLLCRTCLQKQPKPASSTSALILCPTCRSCTPRGHIVRVHH